MNQIDEIKEAINVIKENGIKCRRLVAPDYLKVAVKALEKKIPKRYEVLNGEDVCPTCGYVFGPDVARRALRFWKMDFCLNCGQALDWS